MNALPLLALAAALAACQAQAGSLVARTDLNLPLSASPSTAEPVSVSNQISGVLFPGANDPFPTLEGLILREGEVFALPKGATAKPITWQIVERDRNRATLRDGYTLTPNVPGNLTLLAQSGGRTAYLHCAVQAAGLTSPGGSFGPHGTPRRPAFPRPLVIRDEASWAKAWSAWWIPPRAPYRVQADSVPLQPIPPQPIPAPAPPSDPPPPVAPAIDFSQRSVLLVDIDMHPHRSTRPVVTHLEGNTVHLTIPDVFFPNAVSSPEPSDPNLPRPDTSYYNGRIGYAFNLPALAPGVRVRLAPFLEGQQVSSVTDEPEAVNAEQPFPTASPAFIVPADAAELGWSRTQTSHFEVHTPSQVGFSFDLRDPTQRSGALEGNLPDDQRIGWEVKIHWEPLTAASLDAAARNLEAGYRAAGTLEGGSAALDWAGTSAYRVGRRGAGEGRAAQGATYLAVRDGLLFRFDVLTYQDVTRAPLFERIESVMLKSWKWKDTGNNARP